MYNLSKLKSLLTEYISLRQDSFFFDQDLQREVPGVFDPKKITDAHFDQAMDYKDESFIAARMRLFDISKNEIASATHNKISFERWKPLIGIASGQGAITQFRKSWFVLYANGSQLKQGIMEVEVLLPGN